MPVPLIHPGRRNVTSAPKAVRRSARSCPVCGKSRCQNTRACRTASGVTEWLGCPACAGSDHDTTGFRSYCPDCGGAKVPEAEITHAPGVAE